jgi:acyl-coenzyme A thioesterase PaaI-like protein
LPASEGKTDRSLDAAIAVPLLITAFEGLRAELTSRGLLGSDEASSRRFIFRFITTRALASCLHGGAASGACDYGTLAAAWKAQGVGKEAIDPAGTFSRWTDAVRSLNDESVYQTSDVNGQYDIRVWFFRPGRKKGGRTIGAGVNASILRDNRELEIRANPAVVVPDEYRLRDALASDEERLGAEISRVLTVVRQALRGLPVRVVQLLAKNPGRITIDDQMSWWSALKKAAKQTAITAGSLFALLLTFCALPGRVQEKVFNGFSYAARKAQWSGDRPDVYYGPRRINLRALEAGAVSFGAIHPGSTARDAKTDVSVTVERVASDPLWLRIRVEPEAQFRVNRTKYYINFGEHPNQGGFDVVMLGPAAVVEHRFPAPGTYGLLVSVAVDDLTEEQRQYVPEAFPIDEAWGWTQQAMVSAKIVVPPPA